MNPLRTRLDRFLPVVYFLFLPIGLGVYNRSWGGAASAPPSYANTPAVESGTGAVVAVKTAVLKSGTLEEKVSAYGRVIPIPGHTQVFSVPYESVVRRVFVTEGRFVGPGHPLLEVVASPAEKLELELARAEETAASKTVALVQERMKLELATRKDLLDARQALTLADRRLKSLLERGLAEQAVVKSSTASVVWKIEVRPGQVVPAGYTMMTLVPSGQVGVLLGVEPEEISRIRVGQKTELRQVNVRNPEPIEGVVSMITRQINARTRLIDVLIRPVSPKTGLLLNDYVSGEVVISSRHGLIVPRTAVLPEEGGSYTLFTLAGNKAVEHHVHIGLEGYWTVQVSGKDLREGMVIVVSGNYELADGVSVREEVAE